MAALNPRRQAVFIAGALLAAGLLLCGCTNPFAPAKPQPPNGGGVIEDFSTPDRLLQTIEDAIKDKGPSGATAYADAMGDSTGPGTRAFYAFHDSRVVDAWRIGAQRDPPSPWDLRLERIFYNYLIGVFPTFEYTFQWASDPNSPLDDRQPESAVLHRYYVLQASGADGAIQKIIAIGYADLYLQKRDSRWFLYRWQDRLDENIGVNPTDTDNRTMGWRRLDSQTRP